MSLSFLSYSHVILKLMYDTGEVVEAHGKATNTMGRECNGDSSNQALSDVALLEYFTTQLHMLDHKVVPVFLRARSH